MNALLRLQPPRRLGDLPQAELPLVTEGVQRFVWESRSGWMLIEVVDGVAYVNGERVEPAHVDKPQSV